ncbi:enoyl-CoA hydratase/isomerase domain protein [Acinetobacter baumannii UH5207]|nr:enoyl-CoA hydratase/isomerase domain protein [Acinetobacter baumannii UH5207]
MQELIKASTAADGVLLLTLNRPEKRNALNNATLQCLCELLEEAEHNAQVKAVVLTGNAQCFAAGADLSELAAMDAVTLHSIFVQSFGKKLMRLVSHSLVQSMAML